MNTYGTFALVIGLVSWIYLVASATLLSAEVNVVAHTFMARIEGATTVTVRASGGRPVFHPEVVDPCPLWCWSLVTRADDERESIAALREHAVGVMQPAAPPTAPAGPIWLPSADPHRDRVRSLE